MNRDFKVGQSNELLKEGRAFDLHNCFDFRCLVLLGSSELRLSFTPNEVHGLGHAPVIIVAKAVDRVEIGSPVELMTTVDLDEIGYKSADDHDDSWLLTESQSGPEDDLFFRFIGGNYVRFHCSDVYLVECDQPSCINEATCA